MISNDFSFIRVAFSRDTNAVFGPGWFLCRKLIDFDSTENWFNSNSFLNVGTLLDKSSLCSWRSTLELNMVHSKSFIDKLQNYFLNNQQHNVLLDVPLMLVNNSGLAPLYGVCPVLFNRSAQLQIELPTIEIRGSTAGSMVILPESKMFIIEVFHLMEFSEWTRQHLFLNLTLIQEGKQINARINTNVSTLTGAPVQYLIHQEKTSDTNKNYSISDPNLTICFLIGSCTSLSLNVASLSPSKYVSRGKILYVYNHIISPYGQNAVWVNDELTFYSFSGVHTISPINGSILSTRRSKLTYAWNISCFENSTSIVMSSKLTDVVWNSSIFSIPRNRLEPGWACAVFLTVFDTISGIWSMTQKASFRTKIKISSFQLTPSQSTFLLSHQDSLTIDATANTIFQSASRRILTNSAVSADIKYVWSCDTQYRDSGSFSDIAMLASSLSTTFDNVGFSQCGLNILGLTNTSSKVKLSSKDNGNTNSTSIVRVTLMKRIDGGTERWCAKESKSFVVVVKPQRLPVIKILTPVDRLRRVVSGQDVILEAQIRAPIRSSDIDSFFVGTASWSLLTFSNQLLNASLPLRLVRPRILDTASLQWNNVSTLVAFQIPASFLQDGGYYVFRLTCGE